MATEFDPDIFLFGDRGSQGRWEIGHFRQHLRYLDVLARQNPPIILSDEAIITMGQTNLEHRIWLNSHQVMHELLRPYANVTGIDLALVDLRKEEEFYTWLDLHSQEHKLIDTAFGVS